MELLGDLFNLFIHLDKHMNVIIQSYGTWTYMILFAIIFCETGLVVTPFLPGDSLLFAAGAFAALGSLDVGWLLGLLVVAAVVGDTVNYWIGNSVGPRAFSGNVRFLKQDYLDRTQLFYERHGGKAIVLARFIPIVRTFAPFVAGVGSMRYRRFILYNVAGGLIWVTLFTLAGYFFGNLPAVRQNFTFVVLAIIAISVLPVLAEFLKARLRSF